MNQQNTGQQSCVDKNTAPSNQNQDIDIHIEPPSVNNNNKNLNTNRHDLIAMYPNLRNPYLH